MITAILLDIEGTVSSLDFVKDVLFPYAKKNLKSYLSKNQNNGEVKKAIQEMEKISQKSLSMDEAIDMLTKWMNEDRKITPLKTIQGLIWEEGFKKKEFQAHIYPDALQKMEKWSNGGMPLYIYSSGSVFAQKLFFKYSEGGDLTQFISGYFDTTTGNKKEAASYRKIGEKLGKKIQDILFFSDNNEELNAAAEAGMKTVFIHRGKQRVRSNHRTFTGFEDIDLISMQTWKSVIVK